MFSSTARHLGTKRRGDVTAKMRVVDVLHLLLYAPRARTLTVRREASTASTPRDSVGVSPRDPSFLVTDLGMINLSLQPFPPQLSGDITKKGSLSGTYARCHPSGSHLLPHCKSASTGDLFFSSDWVLHHLCSHHTDEWAWEIQQRLHGSTEDWTCTRGEWVVLKMEFPLHFFGTMR